MSAAWTKRVPTMQEIRSLPGSHRSSDHVEMADGDRVGVAPSAEGGTTLIDITLLLLLVPNTS